MPCHPLVDSTGMIRFLSGTLLILTLLVPDAESGLFSRKKKAPSIQWGVSRSTQEKRAEKAKVQRQKNRDKQRLINAATEKRRAKSLEIRAKSSPEVKGN